MDLSLTYIPIVVKDLSIVRSNGLELYVGAAIIFDDCRIGALSIYDTNPGEFNFEEKVHEACYISIFRNNMDR